MNPGTGPIHRHAVLDLHPTGVWAVFLALFWAVLGWACANGETVGRATNASTGGIGSPEGGDGGSSSSGGGGSPGGSVDASTGGSAGSTDGSQGGNTGGSIGIGGDIGTGNGGTGGNIGGGGGPGGSAGDGGPGGVGAAIPLPMVVSDYYAPSGFMGDGQSVTGAVVVEPAGCKTPRAAGALGACYRIIYLPPPLDAGQTVRWAGVYWQGPPNNWGQIPGRRVEPGASQVSFFAAGETGQETIRFKVGGIISADRAAQPYADTFDVQTQTPLTTTWTRQILPLGAPAYSEVIGAFCWVAEATTTTPIIFYVDGIVWEK
jgi:hypothetical protein